MKELIFKPSVFFTLCGCNDNIFEYVDPFDICSKSEIVFVHLRERVTH